MTCEECLLSYVDLKDDEDIYYCPFDLKHCFHSGEKCHYPQFISKMVLKLRPMLNLYAKTITAQTELIDNGDNLIYN